MMQRASTPFIESATDRRSSVIESSLAKLWECRGIAMPTAEYELVAQGIRGGLYTQVATDRLGQPVFVVNYRGEMIYLVWSLDLDCVRTFLARNMFTDRERARARVKESPRWQAKMAAAASFKIGGGRTAR